MPVMFACSPWIRCRFLSLRADAVPSGELFPHLYGALPVEAVTSVIPYPSD